MNINLFVDFIKQKFYNIKLEIDFIKGGYYDYI